MCHPWRYAQIPVPATTTHDHVLSLIVYGRNDQHGDNSHRRVALSLNAMAEVLTGPVGDGDVILSFVPVARPAASGELVGVRGMRLRAAR